MDEDAVLACLRLYLVRGIGPYIGNQLISYFGSAVSFWQADAQAWQGQDGVGPKLIKMLQQSNADTAHAMAALCNKNNIHILVRDDPAYPKLLQALDDAPLVLFLQGCSTALENPWSLAVVGARKASKEGRIITRRWCEYFSGKKVMVISGMAYGIDTAAHGGALAGATPTVAVLGCGLASLYPMQQRQTSAIIEHGGCVISEYPPEQAARPESFPQRNRIIAGLSTATLVMEADIASGSLITARHAVRYSRDVFAVPGSVLNQTHAGCHQLIREGASLAESADDVLQALDWHQAASSMDKELAMVTLMKQCNAEEQNIIRALQHEVLHLDQLAEACQSTIPALAPLLLGLEMQQIIESLPGSRYTLR
ncbi:MAG: DNA-processing protein DprA [Mariprofundaceae bacterium]|nr:DNA-processing protein DprA [Mariprofundaceae bacterium]